MNITPIPALSDNYIYALQWGNKCLIIDPAESGPVNYFLKENNLELEAVLLTHHHTDHIDGVKGLNPPKVYGPTEPRLPFPVTEVKEGDSVEIGPAHFKVIEAPGHTTSHIAYHEPQLKLLFCGDILFGSGCGRVFEGTYEQMWNSLQKLRTLSEETDVYFGHEYTKGNLEFALSLCPQDPLLLERKKTLPKVTTPTTLATEKKANLFLRADDPIVAKALNMPEASPLEVFSFLRDQRNLR
jgi:hydroxyacylglutathione hydrolase